MKLYNSSPRTSPSGFTHGSPPASPPYSYTKNTVQVKHKAPKNRLLLSGVFLLCFPPPPPLPLSVPLSPTAKVEQWIGLLRRGEGEEEPAVVLGGD
ncbi:Hypothetical predicted protein [Xyrichtys novacula]|uniref:Uncharacterized protein n=1 Tax=Xyrichtys novacula TaxID=13765 RepID=A0AAV1F217_XYRNO|nr:Hypothetical predicted protein [Xyrichtys novacula]